jgi:DNA transformation protein and related proteins
MSMQSRTAWVDHCLELLAPMGEATARSMFGGHGLRIDGVFVALIAFERLFLKADALTRPQFEAAGCTPFVYEGKGKPVTMSYWTVPPQAMESPADMQPWARLALDAALRAGVAARSARPRGRKARHAAAPAASRASPGGKSAARKPVRGSK